MSAPRGVRRFLFAIVTFIAIWPMILFVTAIGEDLLHLAGRMLPRAPGPEAQLPNYPDEDLARRLFEDFERMEEDYVPFVAWQHRPLESENVNIDENGWRVHSDGPENNVATPRSIGFFGGSTMLGKGAADNDTIPAIFDQQTRDYLVTNHGQEGHNSRQMLALLIDLINTGRMPDVVVFYGGYNHVWTHCNYAVTRRLNGHMAERRLGRALNERPHWGYVIEDLVVPMVGRVQRLVGDEKFSGDEPACHTDPVRAEQVSETLLRTWELAQLMVEANGGRFYGFLQPVAYVGEPRLDHLTLEGRVGAAEFPVAYPLIQQKFRERDLAWFTDLSDAFDGDEYLYIDDAHVTRPGNEIIARRMLEKITCESEKHSGTGFGR